MHINAKEFYVQGSNGVGVLLIHGFTGSPAEMLPIKDVLVDEGYSILGVRLKGHGESPEAMEKTTWRDWIDSSIGGYQQLSSKCERIIVIGLSMGAILALYLAQQFKVEGVVALAPAIVIKNRWKARIAFLLKYFVRYQFKNKRMWPDDVKDYAVSYDRTPIKSIPHLLKVISITKKGLHKIMAPTLLIHSKLDRTALPISSQIIYDSISSSNRELVLLEKSGHIITIDCEREVVMSQIKGFLREVAASEPKFDKGYKYKF